MTPKMALRQAEANQARKNTFRTPKIVYQNVRIAPDGSWASSGRPTVSNEEYKRSFTMRPNAGVKGKSE